MPVRVTSENIPQTAHSYIVRIAKHNIVHEFMTEHGSKQSSIDKTDRRSRAGLAYCQAYYRNWPWKFLGDWWCRPGWSVGDVGGWCKCG